MNELKAFVQTVKEGKLSLEGVTTNNEQEEESNGYIKKNHMEEDLQNEDDTDDDSLAITEEGEFYFKVLE